MEKDWADLSGPYHIKAAAEHYSVFQHLFGDAYFYPNVSLEILFKFGESLVPVYRGNCLKPLHVS